MHILCISSPDDFSAGAVTQRQGRYTQRALLLSRRSGPLHAEATSDTCAKTLGYETTALDGTPRVSITIMCAH